MENEEGKTYRISELLSTVDQQAYKIVNLERENSKLKISVMRGSSINVDDTSSHVSSSNSTSKDNMIKKKVSKTLYYNKKGMNLIREDSGIQSSVTDFNSKSGKSSLQHTLSKLKQNNDRIINKLF